MTDGLEKQQSKEYDLSWQVEIPTISSNETTEGAPIQVASLQLRPRCELCQKQSNKSSSMHFTRTKVLRNSYMSVAPHVIVKFSRDGCLLVRVPTLPGFPNHQSSERVTFSGHSVQRPEKRFTFSSST